MPQLKLESKKDLILELLDSGKNTMEIARYLEEYQQAVRKIIKKYRPEMTFVPNQGNINYFETIDTYAKAYLLGFIAADGALVKNKWGPITLTITVKYEDKAVLKFLKSEIGNSHNLLEIKRPSAFDKSKTIHHIRWSMTNAKLVSDIKKYGIDHNKSLTMGNILCNIPYMYRDAFIIGYFDGDGSVMCRDGKHKNSKGIYVYDYSLYVQFRGTLEFFSGVCEHLQITKSHIHQHDSIPCLSFANKRDIVRFFQCYNNLPFYYKRKYDIFLKRINHKSYDKYKQGQTISSPQELP